MDRSRDPIWYLERKVLPNCDPSNSSDPTEDELARLHQFVRRLEKCLGRYFYNYEDDDALHCLRILRGMLLYLEKHQLRAAYNDEIWRLRLEYERKWPWSKPRKRIRQPGEDL